MNKNFIKYLIVKPDSYILVWAYIYSRLDDNNCTSIYIFELMSRFNLAKSTMKRIVDYGMQHSELNLDYKWISNYLHISGLNSVSEPKMVSKRTKGESQVSRNRAKAKPNTLYSKMVDEYDKFCNEKTGVGCKIDGAQGKSMKQIVAFLEKQITKKDNTLKKEELDEKVLFSWQYILTHWDKLDNYNRGRIKLTEINSNMLNILIKLREQPINHKQKQRNEQINKAVRGAESTDYSRLGNS